MTNTHLLSASLNEVSCCCVGCRENKTNTWRLCSLILGASLHCTLLIPALTWNSAFQVLNPELLKQMKKISPGCVWNCLGMEKKKSPSWQKPRSVKKTAWRIFSFGKKPWNLKTGFIFFFLQIRTLIYLRWVFESFLTDLKGYWRIFYFLPLPLLGLSFVLHFNLPACSPRVTFHLVLTCPCVWLFLFLLNFYKEQPLFYSSSERNPCFVSLIEFLRELQCSVFISCRLGQYHLCFKSWAAAVRTSIFFQSPSAFRKHSPSNERMCQGSVRR